MTIRYGSSGIIQIMDNTIIYQSLSISACVIIVTKIKPHLSLLR
jgi:hypothetical protein